MSPSNGFGRCPIRRTVGERYVYCEGVWDHDGPCSFPEDYDPWAFQKTGGAQ